MMKWKTGCVLQSVSKDRKQLPGEILRGHVGYYWLTRSTSHQTSCLSSGKRIVPPQNENKNEKKRKALARGLVSIDR